MANSNDMILKLYEGSLRALDTKSQIFLAFLAITMTPVFNRLEGMGVDHWVRVLHGVCLAGATLAFVFCLMPRRGRRSSGGIFDSSISGQEVAAHLRAAEYAFAEVDTIAALHDIYRLKARSVALGTWLVGLYILLMAASFTVG